MVRLLLFFFMFYLMSKDFISRDSLWVKQFLAVTENVSQLQNVEYYRTVSWQTWGRILSGTISLHDFFQLAP